VTTRDDLLAAAGALADDGVAAREDVDAEADLVVQRFLRVVAQDCGQNLREKDVEARMSSRA
jgi:hypothetical protein